MNHTDRCLAELAIKIAARAKTSGMQGAIGLGAQVPWALIGEIRKECEAAGIPWKRYE